MKLVELTPEQLDGVEEKLEAFDEVFLGERPEGNIRIGIEEDGVLVAGLVRIFR